MVLNHSSSAQLIGRLPHGQLFVLRAVTPSCVALESRSLFVLCSAGGCAPGRRREVSNDFGTAGLDQK